MNIENFKRDHLTVMGKVDDLRRLVQAGIGDNAETIAGIVVSMNHTIKLHLAAEDRVLYPAFTRSRNAAAIQVAKKFQVEMGSIAAAYNDFSLNWNTSSKVKADPEGFRKAANQVYKALHDRIRRENRHLYPLAEQV
jgi:hemerythrin-like domain-containing protein